MAHGDPRFFSYRLLGQLPAFWNFFHSHNRQTDRGAMRNEAGRGGQHNTVIRN